MSIYGTAGSGTYSVSYPNLDAMMTALKDNTSGAIYASTLRNAVLTLYSLSSTSSVASSNVIYTSNTASTIAVGGLSVGTNFSGGLSIQQILDTMLHPYVPPVINSFNLSVGLAGQNYKDTYLEYSSGAASNIFFNFSISNGSINILTSGPSNPIKISGPDGFTYLSSNPAYFYTLGTQNGPIVITPNTASILTLTVLDGVNTITSTVSVQFQNKFYWGNSTKGTASTYLSSDILAANGAGVSINGNLGNILTNTKTQILNGINGSGNYLFFAFPTSFGSPTFITNGLPNTAFTMQSLNFTNANGYSASYSVWISNTAQNSPITLFQIN